jgi:hypothetical protein
VTSPSALPPHQDPQWRAEGGGEVTILEYVTTIVATLDRRFDTLHEDLKTSIVDRFNAVDNRFGDYDLRYQQRFDAQTKALDAALAAAKDAVNTALVAAEKATSKAEAAADKRFESVNEFRQTLTDQTGTFLPRSEAEARMTALSEKIDDLKTATAAALATVDVRLAANAAKGQGMSQLWGVILGAAGLVSIIVSLFLATTK